MTNSQEAERHSRFQVNLARFCGYFALTQVAEYAGDKLHNPDVMDVPHGAVIALGLGVAAIGTVISDWEDRKRQE